MLGLMGGVIFGVAAWPAGPGARQGRQDHRAFVVVVAACSSDTAAKGGSSRHSSSLTHTA